MYIYNTTVEMCQLKCCFTVNYRKADQENFLAANVFRHIYLENMNIIFLFLVRFVKCVNLI